MDARIEVVEADITTLEVDVIVNAANESLLGGGGVDGAIHRAAGPELIEECRRLGGCRTGDAKMTRAWKLPCRRILHAVGPVWRGGRSDEDGMLSSCYRRCLELSVENGLGSIAFPALSTGAYRFPADRAASIAAGTVTAFLATCDDIDRVIFCCFDRRSAHAHRSALERLGT